MGLNRTTPPIATLASGEQLREGDLVAFNTRGELVKASRGGAFDVVGVVVRHGGHLKIAEKSTGTIAVVEQGGYLWNPKADPDPISDILTAMGDDRKAIVDNARESIKKAILGQSMTNQPVVGVAEKDAKAGEVVSVALANAKMEFNPPPLPKFPSLDLEIGVLTIPLIPSIPMPKLPSLPNFNFGSIDPSVTTTTMKAPFLKQDAKVAFGKDGTREVWMGLLRPNGTEIKAPNYERQRFVLYSNGGEYSVRFPVAPTKWGNVVAWAIYSDETDGEMLMSAMLNANGTNVFINSGDVLQLDKITIGSSMSGVSVVGKRNELFLERPLSREEKLELRTKMDEARLRLMGAVGKERS